MIPAPGRHLAAARAREAARAAELAADRRRATDRPAPRARTPRHALHEQVRWMLSTGRVEPADVHALRSMRDALFPDD